MSLGSRLFQVATLALLLAAGTECVSEDQPSENMVSEDTVRKDWYFRESLVAINDWEAILSWQAATETQADSTPILPVPSDGQTVEWPNPIPLMLLPTDHQKSRTELRSISDRIEVRHVRTGSTTADSSFAPTDPIVLGYRHPGGGGSDQWNHRYERQFDQLLSFRCQPAPFGLRLEGPWDPRRGKNHIAVAVRNARPESLTLEIQVHALGRQTPAAVIENGEIVRREVTRQTMTLPGGTEDRLSFVLDLSAPGGGLLLITVQVGDQSYWLPLLTHVEDVAAVLSGIEQILADEPQDAAQRQFERLGIRHKNIAAIDSASVGQAWRELYAEANALRDRLLLGRIDFDQLLFVKRKPFISEQPFMDAHHCYNRPGGGIYRLSPVRPDGRVTPIVDSLGDGVYRDLSLKWDAQKIVFSFGNGSDRVRPLPAESVGQFDASQDYNLYEANLYEANLNEANLDEAGVDGEALQQLTFGEKNECEPFYLPSEQIGFTSDAANQSVMCGSDIHVASLFTMNADGTGIRQLGFNVFNEFNPAVLPDGRIIYNRWEYNERSVTSLHDLFTIHPDGTHSAPYYGNATIRPNVIMFPRPVPGSNKIMALFTGHHGQTHGPIGLIDVSRAVDGDEPIRVLTPGVPIVAEKIEDSRRGWYSDPQPLSESTYLCSYTPTVLPWLANSWAIYVGDQHGNLALVYRDPQISCAEPVPVVVRSPPGILRSNMPGSDADDATATLLMMDVYRGLPGVAPGTAKFLRVLEDVPRKDVPRGGVVCTSGTKIYTIKRIHGTVPIESDGSANFEVPANRNLYFEVLDANRREIQRMRSVVCLKPNERRTCIGCHEPRTQAPPNQFAKAFLREPSQPVPPPWGTQTISFLRDVQPLLNEKCMSCHTHDRETCGVILTDDLTDQFTVAYEELLPYLNVANAMRWDNPDDVLPRPPYTYGSNASPLMKLLTNDHHDVVLSDEQLDRLANWIDANGVYYDRYETYTNNRHIFTDQTGQTMAEVYESRCASCHDEDQGKQQTWWTSLNRHDAAMSRSLQAPLAKTAGGWQRCNESVFADTNDPDYQRLLKTLTELQAAMTTEPRADLRSLHSPTSE